MLEYIVAIQAKILAEDHLDRLVSQHALAVAYEANGQIKESITLLEHIVAIRKTLAEDHPDRLVSQHALAVAYEANGQIKEAIPCLNTSSLFVRHSPKTILIDLFHNTHSQ